MKVIERQTNSKSCIICGMENDWSVKAPFYSMEDGTVISIFEFCEKHQSYPGRVHGGMICALLDELVGRALWVQEKGAYAVTTSINIQYRKPVPYGVKLKGVGRIIKNSSRLFVGTGEIYDMEGNLLASAEAKYLKLPAQTISENVSVDDEMCYDIKDGVKEIAD